MTPFLLDKRHVVTVGIIFILSILLCFVGGYVLGYQHAAKATPESLISKLLIPSVGSVKVVLNEEYSTNSNEPGEDIDVDAPDIKLPDGETSDVVMSANVIKNDNQEDITSDHDEVLASLTQADAEPKAIVDNASEADALYSIQVGLYGIKVNAQRRVDDLIDKQLSGHLSNFVNGKGDTLYNVRFGYFLDKTSVLAALKLYQQQHTGDGYIIKLKR